MFRYHLFLETFPTLPYFEPKPTISRHGTVCIQKVSAFLGQQHERVQSDLCPVTYHFLHLEGDISTRTHSHRHGQGWFPLDSRNPNTLSTCANCGGYMHLLSESAGVGCGPQVIWHSLFVSGHQSWKVVHQHQHVVPSERPHELWRVPLNPDWG